MMHDYLWMIMTEIAEKKGCPKSPDGMHHIDMPTEVERVLVEKTGFLEKYKVKYDRPSKPTDGFCIYCGLAIW